MNKQPISKRHHVPNGALHVHSIFYTIQGEGPFAGTPAVFVRLNGCNLQCPGCDTEYTQHNMFVQPSLLVEMIKKNLQGTKAHRPLVVITGGEPFRQNILPLCKLLTRDGEFFVQVESNGTLHPGENATDVTFNQNITSRRGIYVVVSPKTPRINPFFELNACAFKYVMAYDSVSREDGLPIHVLDHMNSKQRVYRQKHAIRPIYLQSMDHTGQFDQWEGRAKEANKKSLEAVKRSCLQYGYILQLQIHKIIGVD